MINYYLLTKPGIIAGNLITLAAGFMLASKGVISPWLFIQTFLGLALVMASGCVLNNYIDRPLDRKMKRTKKRALVTGLISGRNALTFAAFLGVIGAVILITYTNLITLLLAGVGFFFYVVLYSLWKGRTIYGTAIGSIAGAIPPVVGYCAVSARFDLGALLLFLMLVFWQMPHFFSIAINHLEDYRAADMPVLPVKKGVARTKIHMLFYIPAFILVAAMLTFYDYTGYFYLGTVIITGFLWLAICLKGFKINHAKEQLWGRHMFRYSLLTIIAISITMSFDCAYS